jgi:hypothetical protein
MTYTFTVVPAVRTTSINLGLAEYPEGARFGIRAESYAEAVHVAADLLEGEPDVQQRCALRYFDQWGDYDEWLVYNVLPRREAV